MNEAKTNLELPHGAIRLIAQRADVSYTHAYQTIKQYKKKPSIDSKRAKILIELNKYINESNQLQASIKISN